MRILRYLNREVLTTMIAVTAILLVVIVCGRFVKYLAEAAAGDLAADVLLPIMLYRLPGFLELIFPMGLFIGILMAYGRLYVESEMVILSACGVSQHRLVAYTMVSAMLVAALVAVLSLYITPLGVQKTQAIFADPASSQGMSTLTAGRFQVPRSGQASYAERISKDHQRMYEVFLSRNRQLADGTTRTVITVAGEGEVIVDAETGLRYLELREGFQYEGDPGQLDFRITQFETYGEKIHEDAGSARVSERIDGKSSMALWRSEKLEAIAAMQWRLSLPLLVPIVALIALALSRTDHRRGRYLKMFPAFILYLSYLVLLTNTRSILEKGGISPALGLWWVHGVYFVLAILLLYGGGWWNALRRRRLVKA